MAAAVGLRAMPIAIPEQVLSLPLSCQLYGPNKLVPNRGFNIMAFCFEFPDSVSGHIFIS